MNYADEFWIKVYTRDTEGWCQLSLVARAISLELSRKFPRGRGDLPLGWKGLRRIAEYVNAEWSEIEPYVVELLRSGRLVHDEAAGTISDPKHVERQCTPSSPAERKRRQRALEQGNYMMSRASHAMSRDVTSESRDVTIRSDQIRSDQTRSEESERDAHTHTLDSNDTEITQTRLRVPEHIRTLVTDPSRGSFGYSPTLVNIDVPEESQPAGIVFKEVGSTGTGATTKRVPGAKAKKPTRENTRSQLAGTPLPEDWAVSPALLAWAKSKGAMEYDIAETAERFTCYWHTSTAPTAIKRNWDKAFQTWLVRDIESGKVQAVTKAPPAPAVKPPTPYQLAMQDWNRQNVQHALARMDEKDPEMRAARETSWEEFRKTMPKPDPVLDRDLIALMALDDEESNRKKAVGR